jgi:hypothetical protein
MTTVADVLAKCRDRLDETNASGGQWSNVQLRRWFNDAMNEIARTTLHLVTYTDVAVVAGDAEVSLAGTVIEIQQVYFRPTDSDEAIPLTPYHFEAMDAIWGSWQDISSGDPSAFAPWGYSPNLKVRLYPIPGRAGNLRVYHAKQATPIDTEGADDADTLDAPDAWHDLIADYVEYMALRKDRDPRWQEAFQLYSSKVQLMAEHDYLANARDIVHDYVSGGLPRWLVDPSYMD